MKEQQQQQQYRTNKKEDIDLQCISALMQIVYIIFPISLCSFMVLMFLNISRSQIFEKKKNFDEEFVRVHECEIYDKNSTFYTFPKWENYS